MEDTDSTSGSFPQRLFSRTDWRFDGMQVVIACLATLPSVYLISTWVGHPWGWLAWPLIVFWVGLEPSWMDGLGLALYQLAIVFLLSPIASFYKTAAGTTSALEGVGALIGASLTVPIFFTLAVAAAAMGYWIRKTSDAGDYGDPVNGNVQ